MPCPSCAADTDPDLRQVLLAPALGGFPQIFLTACSREAAMNAANKYEKLALHCVNLAEATREPAPQDRLLRLGDFCARLADHGRTRASTGFWPERVRDLAGESSRRSAMILRGPRPAAESRPNLRTREARIIGKLQTMGR